MNVVADRIRAENVHFLQAVKRTIPEYMHRFVLSPRGCDTNGTVVSRKTTRQTKTMMKNSVKPSVIGTRSGYVIRFTCPNCQNENSIVCNMPKAYFKGSRDGTCAKCRKHFEVLTPGQN